MAINTQLQDVNRILQPPMADWSHFVDDIVGGFASAYLARKEQEEQSGNGSQSLIAMRSPRPVDIAGDEPKVDSSLPPGSPQQLEQTLQHMEWSAKKAIEEDAKAYNQSLSGKTVGTISSGQRPKKAGALEKFSRAYLGAEGVRAEAANPLIGPQRRLLTIQAKEAETQNSINAALGRNIVDIGNEFGNARTSEERWSIIQKNAGMAASPLGRNILNQLSNTAQDLDRIEGQTLAKQAEQAKIRRQADLVLNWGADPADPETFISANRRKQRAALRKTMHDLELDPGSVSIPDDLFDEQGNLPDTTVDTLLSIAQPKPSIQARTEIAEERLRLQKEKAEAGALFAPPEIERIFKAAEAEGHPFDDATKQAAREVQLGIKERAYKTPKMQEFVAQQLPSLRRSNPGTSDKELMKRAKESYEALFLGKVEPPAGTNSLSSEFFKSPFYRPKK